MADADVDPVDVHIREYLRELRELSSEVEELESYMAEAVVFESEQIASAEKEIERLQSSIADHRILMREKTPQLSKQIDLVHQDIERLKTKLKKVCHDLPLDRLRAGASFAGSRFSINISKPSVRTTYRTVEMLKAHPELLKMDVEGDPVVTPTIDAPVLDRLIAEEKFSEEEAAKYRIETKIKNPSVRITETAEEERT